MSQASTQVEVIRNKMIAAVDKLSVDDIKSMLLASLNLASLHELNVMAAATSFQDVATMDLELDLDLTA